MMLLAMAEVQRAAGKPLTAPQQEQLKALFEAHYDVVWRVLRRSGLSPAHADDSAQQVFLVAMNRLGDLEAGKERAFLCATAVHVARRTRVGQPREVLTDEPPETEASDRPDESAERKQKLKLLEELLSQLDDDLRAVLVMQEIAGLSKRETAEALSIPEGTVASRLRRAKETFQAMLKARLAGRAP